MPREVRAEAMPRGVGRAAQAWAGFWFSPSSAESLGVARAVFFGALFLLYLPEDFSAWGGVDRVFWAPIWLFRTLRLQPASTGVLSILQVVFKLSLLLGALGLWTRAACAIAFALGLYLFGLPHNFGHTYHFDALLVFVFAIMAVARPGDGWSIDALRRARPADAGPEYTWPVRLVWVAMALVFFAAGLSKLRHGGVEWVLSDNLAIVLVKAHYHVSDGNPIGPWGLMLASSPVASRLVALGSLATETLFPLALVSRRARSVLVPGAFLMLVGIRVLMGPTFGGFLSAFAFWVPWPLLLAWRAAGEPRRYVMLFDGGCGLCTRTVRVLRRIDTRDRIDVLDVARDWESIAARFPSLSRAACLDVMHVITPEGRVETGYLAYRAMAWAVPLAWPVLPLLYLPGAHMVGDRVYRAVARRRLTASCALEPVRVQSQPPDSPHRRA